MVWYFHLLINTIIFINGYGIIHILQGKEKHHSLKNIQVWEYLVFFMWTHSSSFFHTFPLRISILILLISFQAVWKHKYLPLVNIFRIHLKIQTFKHRKEKEHKREKAYSSLRSMIRIISSSYSDYWFIPLFNIWKRFRYFQNIGNL